jgi:hypothetical protein
MVIVIGAPKNDEAALDAGAVYIYEYAGNSQWKFATKLTAPDAQPGEHFGYSVAVSGNTILIGAPNKTRGAYTEAGLIYLFVKTNDGWVLNQEMDGSLYGVPLHNGMRFGYAVDLYGDQAVVSAVSTDDTGNRVYGLVRDTFHWMAYQPIQSPFDGIGFGKSLALYNDYVVVGAPLYDWTGPDSGRIYLYQMSGGNFTELTNPEYSQFGVGHQGGYSVDIYRELPVAGAPYATIAPTSSAVGSVHLYLPNKVLLRAQNIFTDGPLFGWSVRRAGDTLIVGAPNTGYGYLSHPGAVYVYHIEGPPWTTPTFTPEGFMATTTHVVPSLTPSTTPLLPFACSAIQVTSGPWIEGNKVRIHIHNGNSSNVIIIAVNFQWKTLTDYPNMAVTKLAWNDKPHWMGADTIPSTNTNAFEPSTTMPLVSTSPTDRTLVSFGSGDWTAEFANGYLGNTTLSDYYGTEYIFTNPETNQNCTLTVTTPINPTTVPTATPGATVARNFFTTRQPTLTWSAVSWANGYELEISTDAGFLQLIPIFNPLPATPTSFLSPPLNDGTYYWRVRALDANGKPGPWSQTESFDIFVVP